MFELIRHIAKVASISLRAEKHGAEHVPAIDLNIHTTVSGAVLDDFDPDLRPSLFRSPQRDQQSDNDAFTAVRFPRIDGVTWSEEYPGYKLSITGNGLFPVPDIPLDDVKIKKLRIKPLEGGSVALTFLAQGHPDAETIGRLSALIQSDVLLTLTAPLRDDEEADVHDDAQGEMELDKAA